MAQDRNPYEGANRFFASLPYRPLAGERIELRYLDLERRVLRTEFFPGLGAAAREVAALGPTRHALFVGAAPPAAAAQGGARKGRLLGAWIPVEWHGPLPDDFVVELEDFLAPVWAEAGFRRFEGGLVVETVRFFYPDRCSVPDRVRREAETLRPPKKTVGGGRRGRL